MLIVSCSFPHLWSQLFTRLHFLLIITIPIYIIPESIQDLSFLQMIYRVLDDNDGLKGVAAYRLRTSLEERIIDLESEGKVGMITSLYIVYSNITTYHPCSPL